MKSRTKRLLELCNSEETTNSKKAAKENTMLPEEYNDNGNYEPLFNIMDLPVDILSDLNPENGATFTGANQANQAVNTIRLPISNLDSLDVQTNYRLELPTDSAFPLDLFDSNFGSSQNEHEESLVGQENDLETPVAQKVDAGIHISHESATAQEKFPEYPNNQDNDSDEDSDYHASSSSSASDLNTAVEENAPSDEVDESNHLDPTESTKQKRVTGENRKKKNQELRMKGKQYLGYRRPANQNKTFQDIQRSERKIGPPCMSTFCQKSAKRNCNKITERVREEIFEKFWENLTWDQRKTLVCNLVTKDSPKERKAQQHSESRRNVTLRYTIKVDNVNMPVCKRMFLSTFGLKEWQVNNWVSKSTHGMNERKYEKIKQGILSDRVPNVFMKSFLENLNKLPSHYCRKDTSKLYLEQSFTNITELYKVYQEKCKESDETAMSQNSLTKMLKKLNIALYQPKKDECDICCQYKEKNLSEAKWNEHQNQKERAREEKSKDKDGSLRGIQHVVTMDLQAVKVCPSIMASSVYFKTKLCVHNFTVYNLATRHCTCYWFDETQTDLQASTFVSFLIDYIRKHLNDGKPIIIFSDGCTYQNRNNIMSNALLHLAMELKITIEQKFLVKGHTQMECDSVHASIEKKLKNKKIFLPSDYARICEEARTTPEKYNTEFMNYEFFVNYNDIPKIYNSIRPGRTTGDPNVVDLRALKYCPQGVIYYKLHFDDEYKELPQRSRKRCVLEEIVYPKLHKERLKIKESKFGHLQQLKPVIPEDCWPFYDNLPH